ncbi:hypothetical protein AAFC00_004653 [Neodothiora populina]|uniref:Uncharacterized protein n=1 Tax=Neodothiora populina TaxID=2781224 RepID=A0ABR3P307_9PEZI
MGLWQYYRTLTPRTRIYAGAGLIAWALAGQYLSDQAEQTLGFTPTEKDREELERKMPKIRVVDP